MRQAIEEGFILDVLTNYSTYTAYWRLLKKIEDDPRYDRKKAEYLLKSFVDLHAHAIGQKVRICVDHFAAQVQGEIDSKAKAMIVTRSRLHAVRYKLAIDKHLAERGYPFKALVAFSGSVFDGGPPYTEANMNGFPEAQTAKTFERPEYRFLIAANKFQTGFDQPLLHTMYVDKKLGGVNAVQTLSRLNRTHPDKNGTMVLDFANEADEIKAAFEPYYETTLLSEATDPICCTRSRPASPGSRSTPMPTSTILPGSISIPRRHWTGSTRRSRRWWSALTRCRRKRRRGSAVS
jgi:type I restriction enzyme R subunit